MCRKTKTTTDKIKQITSSRLEKYCGIRIFGMAKPALKVVDGLLDVAGAAVVHGFGRRKFTESMSSGVATVSKAIACCKPKTQRSSQ